MSRLSASYQKALQNRLRARQTVPLDTLSLINLCWLILGILFDAHDCVRQAVSIDMTAQLVHEITMVVLVSSNKPVYLQVRVVRIFNTYGPNMALDDGRVVSNFVAQALTGQPLTIFGDGQQTRSFQYVSDLIEGALSRKAVHLPFILCASCRVWLVVEYQSGQ